MGYWVEALKLGTEGKAYDARLLLEEIPDALRQIRVDADGSTRYTGRVPSSVRAFVNALPEDWRALGTLYEDVFIDYIVEDVVLTAAATLVLVEVCRERPEASIEELVELYPWKEGLNRNLEWKRERITDNLRSMLAAGVALPAGTIAALRDEG